MDKSIFDNTQYLRNILRVRRYIIEGLIEDWNKHGLCNSEETPASPCSFLMTELEEIKRYLDIIDRELWHFTQKET